MDRDWLTLGIVASLVAGDIDAVAAMLTQMALVDPRWADELMKAFARGNAAHAAKRQAP